MLSLRTGVFLFLLSTVLAWGRQPSGESHELYVPYWTSEAGWGTEFQLKNNLSSQPLAVTPILRLASGQEIPLSPVTIAANDSVSIFTNMVLLEHAPDLLGQPGSYGSAVFRFNSVASLALHVTSVAMLQGAPIAIPIAGRSSTINQKPTTLEGIWWHPARSGLNDVLVISNVSVDRAIGKLSILDASGKSWSKSLTLGPRQTTRVLVNDVLQQSGLSGSFGGISISFPSSSFAIDAVHFLYDELGKFSAPLEMVRRDPQATVRERTGTDAKDWTMRAPMLALRNPDPALGLSSKTVLQPAILVRNTTAKTISAEITLNWRGDSASGEAKLPPLRLVPFATQQLQVGEMQSMLQIPDTAHWALVSLTTTAQPDDVVAIASSRDPSLRYGAETTFVLGQGGRFAGGELRADANHNAIAAITNVGTKPTDALLTLHYDGGKQKYELQETIAPGNQMWVNLAELIRNRVADRKGNVLPADLRSVTYELRDLSPGGGNLNAGSLALDSTFGFSAAPPFPRCCGEDDGITWNPDGFDLIIDGTEFGSISGYDQCTGQQVDITGDFTTWTSGNPAVATVSTKQVHGVAQGSTDAYANGEVEDGNGGYCTLVPAQAQAPVSVPVFSCSSSVTRGNTAQCQITCNGASCSSAITASGWQFKDGNNNTVTRSTNKTSLSWSGVMVVSGTVNVTIGGETTPRSAQITVNPRNWHTSPASAASVPNGTFYTLPVPPQPIGTDAGLGKFNESTSNSVVPNSTVIGDNGPNTGYAYWATQPSISTLFQYEINPDLQSSKSQFSTHQWGACGYISWSNLLTQTNRHEFNSATQSHYAFYTSSISSGTNNPGDFVETQWAPPGADLSAFASATSVGLSSRYNQIYAATSAEPYPVNYSETGTFLGNINYAPYQSCP